MYNVYFFASSWHKSTPDIVSGFDDEFSFKKHTTFIFRFSYNFPLDPGFGRGGGGGGGTRGGGGPCPQGVWGSAISSPIGSGAEPQKLCNFGVSALKI